MWPEEIKMKLFWLILLILLLANTVMAKTFTSQFCEFELPSGWDCQLEATEWLCQSEDKERKKEAIIVLAAKYRSEQDTLDAYKALLSKPKTFTMPGGKVQVSEAKSVSIKSINGQNWVDALHMASEVPGFYTRYLATVKDSLGIALTFSVSKEHYDAYQDIFEKIAATARVFEQKDGDAGKWVPKKQESDLLEGPAVVGNLGTNPDISMQGKKQQSAKADSSNQILMFVALAIVGFIIVKKLKNKS